MQFIRLFNCFAIWVVYYTFSTIGRTVRLLHYVINKPLSQFIQKFFCYDQNIYIRTYCYDCINNWWMKMVSDFGYRQSKRWMILSFRSRHIKTASLSVLIKLCNKLRKNTLNVGLHLTCNGVMLPYLLNRIHQEKKLCTYDQNQVPNFLNVNIK